MDIVDELSVSCCTTELYKLARHRDSNGPTMSYCKSGDANARKPAARLTASHAGQLRSSSSMATGSSTSDAPTTTTTNNSNNNGVAQQLAKEQNIDNNSNKKEQRHRGGGGGQGASEPAYSKLLFRQYLPNSFNLNHSGKQKSTITSSRTRFDQVDAQYQRKQEQEQTIDRQRRAARSLVSRLTGKLHQSAKLLPPSDDKPVSSRQLQQSDSDKIGLHQQQVRRKGFLYLKRDISGSNSAAFIELANNNNNNNNNSSSNNDKSTSCKTDGNNNWNFSFNHSQSQRRLKHERRKQVKLLDEEAALDCHMMGAGLGALGLLVAISALLVSAEALQQVPPASFRSQTSPATGPVGRAGAAALPQPAAGSLVANVNCNKIRGHVSLTPNLQGGSTVSTQISAGPPGEVYQWSVHQFPVKAGSAMCSCSALILGAKLLDLSEMHGNLPSDQEFSVQSSLNLFGPDSPVGHSLLLRGMKTGMVACATFLPTSRKSNYRAKLHTPLSGSVTIFQTAFGTSFISHLMYSNGTRRHSSHRFDLIRSSDDDIMAAAFPLSGAQAASASAAAIAARSPAGELENREFEHEITGCRRLTTSGGLAGGSWEPLLRNSSYQLMVSTENFGMRGRSAHVLPQIPFETFSSVYLVIYSEFDPAEPIACAPLRFVKPKTAAAKFQSVAVQGNVIFSQDSPYDPTVARVNLNLPNSDGHSYGIDELPMIIRRKSDTRVCPNIREIIYNPHHVEPSSVPAEGEATSDQYAVGDLSGKYGSLTGKSSEKIQVTDYNLPLFGPVSIVGRAMTVYSADGVAIACSNVELTAPMTTAFATFDFGIQGQFIFRQPVNDCHGDTYVYIEVSKPVLPASASSAAPGAAVHVDHNSQRTTDHNWHIHTNPVDSGLEHLSTSECAPAGPHYNPYNTSTSSIYSRDCTPFNVLRCELGDLSSKMFTIDIPPYRVKGAQEPDIGKFFGTDIDLPLCGPTSIVNRSVVVHQQDFGHQRLACSTVIEFKPRSAA